MAGDPDPIDLRALDWAVLPPFFHRLRHPPRSAPHRRRREPLELPAPWNPPSRPAVPVLASVVPVLGAVALWLVTGSVLALWLAALGPLIAGATMLDGHARGAA